MQADALIALIAPLAAPPQTGAANADGLFAQLMGGGAGVAGQAGVALPGAGLFGTAPTGGLGLALTADAATAAATAAAAAAATTTGLPAIDPALLATQVKTADAKAAGQTAAGVVALPSTQLLAEAATARSATVSEAKAETKAKTALDEAASKAAADQPADPAALLAAILVPAQAAAPAPDTAKAAPAVNAPPPAPAASPTPPVPTAVLAAQAQGQAQAQAQAAAAAAAAPAPDKDLPAPSTAPTAAPAVAAPLLAALATAGSRTTVTAKAVPLGDVAVKPGLAARVSSDGAPVAADDVAILAPAAGDDAKSPEEQGFGGDGESALAASTEAGGSTSTAADAGVRTSFSAALANAQAPAVRAGPTTIPALAAQMARQIDGRASRFDVQLSPAGLGQVTVSVEIGRQGQIRAAFAFEKPQTAAELKARSGELQSALEQAGFDLASGGLSFDTGAGTDLAGQNTGGGQTFADRAPAPFSLEGGPATIETAARAAVQADRSYGLSGASADSLDIRI